MAIDYTQFEVQDDGSTLHETAPNKITANPAQSLAGLPRHGAVEAQIQSRPDLLSQGIANIGRTVSPEEIHPFPRIMSPIVGSVQALGGAFQRAEAAVANPVLELQKMGVAPDEEMAKYLGSDYLTRPIIAMVEGIKGERLGETGDPYRKQFENPIVSEAVGIASGLFTMNAFMAAKPLQVAGKLKKGKIDKYDELANANVQALGNSIKRIGKATKDKYRAAVEPFKNSDTSHRVTDVASKIGNKFADVFDNTLGRLNRITKGTDTGLIEPSGQNIVRRLTIGELGDLIGDMQADVNRFIMSTLEATGKKPPAHHLYALIDDVKNLYKRSFPQKVQKIMDPIIDEYARIIPKVDDLMYEMGWSGKLKSFDSSKAKKLFTSTGEATKRGFIKKFAALDKNITKYYNNLIKWGHKISPKKLSALDIGIGASAGAALGQKLAGKASNIIMPADSVKAPGAGVN